MSELALDIRDVSKRFGPRWAVARLTFQLPRGKSLLLTGHNGSGKTSLLRMIATATFPTVGEISVLGLDTRKGRLALRPRVGLLSHANYLYEDLSALQNLLLVASFRGIGDAKKKCETLLERVGLAERRDHPVRQFSAGMRKRVAIARLLLKAPEMALFDEPFGELDPAGILQMESLIRELKNQGTTLILATHIIEQGERLTEQRLHLENGRVKAAA